MNSSLISDLAAENNCRRLEKENKWQETDMNNVDFGEVSVLKS